MDMVKTSMSTIKRDKVFIKVHPSSVPLCSPSQLILINGTRPVIGQLTMTKCWLPCKVQIPIRIEHPQRCLDSPWSWALLDKLDEYVPGADQGLCYCDSGCCGLLPGL